MRPSRLILLLGMLGYLLQPMASAAVHIDTTLMSTPITYGNRPVRIDLILSRTSMSFSVSARGR